MKKAIAFLLVFALISAAVMAADVASRTFPLDCEIYELMDDLYSLQGLARPSTSRPWSQSEAKLILSRIDESTLNSAEKRLYDRIQDIISENLRWNFSDFALGLKIDPGPVYSIAPGHGQLPVSKCGSTDMHFAGHFAATCSSVGGFA